MQSTWNKYNSPSLPCPHIKTSGYMQDTAWCLFPKIMFIFTDLIPLYWPELDSEGVCWFPQMLS